MKKKQILEGVIYTALMIFVVQFVSVETTLQVKATIALCGSFVGTFPIWSEAVIGSINKENSKEETDQK